MRLPLRLLAAITVLLLQFLPVAAAWAVGASAYPALPQQHLIDPAELFSRATAVELERRLKELQADHIEARLVTVQRLDYGLDLETLGQQLIDRWSTASSDDSSQLILLIDSQTNTAAVVASDTLLDQLPESLLRNTADRTMAIPIRLGSRYRQASLDALDRITAVLAGGEDPGPPLEQVIVPVESNIPTQEETASSNGFTWIVVLLVVGTVVPMLTWWVFSR
ncbi:MULTISPECIES: photosystem II repair protein Psb32 [unclassified Synechococcus]|uniref:photosystem II repair protein Psb32 n=1 Tax=unclassified Synechococcus TaxID=2626047 RepID=UPI000B999581|nr:MULTISPECIES: TPM domain-containing protein [unclassified Synechococcus]MCP9828869.1 TPM domain-containing protein [Synechococcus sp. L2F]MCP9845380.1 TPM domain-containing protein [Synechococcus sp. Lug-A]